MESPPPNNTITFNKEEFKKIFHDCLEKSIGTPPFEKHKSLDVEAALCLILVKLGQSLHPGNNPEFFAFLKENTIENLSPVNPITQFLS